jgi:hypothetical protein
LWHTDCNGFRTYIDTQVGYKWWVIGTPKEAWDSSDISFFTEKFQLDNNNKDLCTLEVGLLPPGSQL